jgi:hypothetical protein
MRLMFSEQDHRQRGNVGKRKCGSKAFDLKKNKQGKRDWNDR